MQNHEFITEIQRHAGLESKDDALNVTKAVLETLADHQAGNAPAKLAAQLPEGIAECITNYKSDVDAEGEGFPLQEFYNRVATRAAIDSEKAVKYSQAVFAVLQEAVTDGEIEKIRGTLPPEYAELFDGERRDN